MSPANVGLVVSLFAFLVVVVKILTDKSVFTELKDSIRDLKTSLDKNTDLYRDEQVQSAVHLSQSTRTHCEVHDIHTWTADIKTGVDSNEKEIKRVHNRLEDGFSRIEAKLG